IIHLTSPRFMQPGPDPTAGMIVGIFDILRGGRTAIGKDCRFRFDGDMAEPTWNVAGALVRWFLHLLSDVTTRMGLPAPLMTLSNLMRFGSWGERERSVADLCRYMYHHGYDLRHFMSSMTAPAASRILLHGYWGAWRYLDPQYNSDCVQAAASGAGYWKHEKLNTLQF